MMQKTVKIGLAIVIIVSTVIGAIFVFRAKRPLGEEEVVELAREYAEKRLMSQNPLSSVIILSMELHSAELLPVENAIVLLERWTRPEHLPARLPDKMWLVEFDVELTIEYWRTGETANETRRTHAIIDGYTGDHLAFVDETLAQEWLD